MEVKTSIVLLQKIITTELRYVLSHPKGDIPIVEEKPLNFIFQRFQETLAQFAL
jgi:hypothetical protein